MKPSLALLALLALVWAPLTVPHAQESEAEDSVALGFGTLSGIQVRSIGPAFMSGRISEVVVDPIDRPGTSPSHPAGYGRRRTVAERKQHRVRLPEQRALRRG